MHALRFTVGGGDAKERAMKRLAIVAAAFVLVLSTTMAPAGVIHRRQKHQQARIRQGVRSGEVTPEAPAVASTDAASAGATLIVLPQPVC